MKHDVTYSIRGLNAVFTDEVQTENGTYEEITAAVKKVISETVHDERLTLREIVLVIDK